MSEKPLWPWQERGLAELLKSLEAGGLSVCLTAPTGMGKGRTIEELSRYYLERGGRVILLTNRRLLTKQTGRRMKEAGIEFGYVSAAHGVDTTKQLLVASSHTLKSRVKRKRMELPHADILIVDEAHNGDFDKVVAEYRRTHPGVTVVGITASPVGLKGQYDSLLIAGTKREGRAHDALVPCIVYAPSEPDMRGVKMNAVGEYVQDQMVKRVMQCTVFADVFDNWLRLGGASRPTILWAPGVPESRWFVEEFRKRGISAEHIDAKTSEEERERIARGSRDGSIQVVSSFGVLREGIDWPWLSYGILVQVCGSIKGFVQTVGRLLRAYPGKADAILQDHSGTWWRHGSPNSDIDWTLDCTNKSIAKQRKKKLESGEEREPICCPQCNGIRACGSKCPHCGYEHTRSVRMVRMVDGRLVRMVGGVVKRKRAVSEDQRQWTAALFRCGPSNRSLNQALGLCGKELGHHPVGVQPWPEGDWDQKVKDVLPWTLKRRAKRAVPA